ncbi:unnamed protein product [Durusdinium trenchii]|uniref:EGF-like domain-containing protein n=1 Tax=Durusdinium trenchii TaxID=1381693 RepID=A0ABP0L3E8_9DINO
MLTMVRATPLIPENPWNFLPKCLSGSAHFIQGARDGKCQIAEGYRMQKTTMQERDTGGSCRFFACDSSRGPTRCDRGQGYKCICAEGFLSVKGQCQPKLVKVQPEGAPQGGAPAPAQTFDWTKVDWSKIFQNQGWSSSTDWSKFDWSKIYGASAPAAPAPAPPTAQYDWSKIYGAPAPPPPSMGYGGMPYGQPGTPYAYGYGMPYWR